MPTQNQIDAWQQKRKNGDYEKIAKQAAKEYYEAIKNNPTTSDYIREGEVGARAGMGLYTNFEEYYEANKGTFDDVLSNVISTQDCKLQTDSGKCLVPAVSDKQFEQFNSEAELLDFIQRNAEVATAYAVKISAELDEAAYTLIDPSKGYTREQISDPEAFKKRQDELQKEQSDRATAITTAVGELDLIAFSEQCFLMSQVFNLIDLRKVPSETESEEVFVSTPLPGGGVSVGWETQPVTKYDKVPPLADGVGNNTLLIEGSPYNFMNKLTQNADYSNFFDMTAAEISHLQPSIRLYKVIQDIETGEEVEHEIRFDSHYTQNDLQVFESKKTRGVGVGIKSFNFSFEGTDYYAVKRSIKANLVIFANDFNELLKTRKSTYLTADGKTKTAEYQYIDMALKTSNTPTAEFGEKQNRKSEMIFNSDAKLNFRLKAVIGWAVPRESALNTTGLRNSIYNSYITLQLTPTVHSFDFDDLGRCTFTIPYLAYSEDAFDHPNFNIFTEPLSVQILERRETDTEAINTFCDLESTRKITEDQKEARDLETDYMKGRLFTHLMAKAIANKAIRYIPLKYSDIKEFNRLGAGFDYSSYFNNITTETADESMILQIVGDAQASNDDDSLSLDVAGAGVDYLKVYSENDNFNVNFFYLSDMVDVIMDGIEQSFDFKKGTLENLRQQKPSYIQASQKDWETIIDKRSKQIERFYNQYRKLRVVLGPMEIVDPKDAANSKTISMGDLPISNKYFQEWMIKEVEKEEKAIFSLTEFLNKFLNQFVADTLNIDTCFRGQIKQTTKVTQAAVTAYKENVDLPDAISDKILSEGWNGRYNIEELAEIDMPLLAISGDRNLPGGRPAKDAPEREIHYLIYYAGRTQPQEAQNGVRTEDHNRGVFHYGIGQRKGIVKTINFQRQSVPSLKMVAFEQNGYKGITQLREQYDVEIKTFANVKAQPGCYIYVEPQSFAPGAKIELTELGVGGYYMITRSEHKFGPGLAESVITAKWVHGLHEFPPSEDTKTNEEVSETPKGKCSIRP